MLHPFFDRQPFPFPVTDFKTTELSWTHGYSPLPSEFVASNASLGS